MRTRKFLLLTVAVNDLIGISGSPPAFAAGDADAEMKAKIEARKKEVQEEIAAEAAQRNGYYKEAGSYGTKRISTPPPYSVTLNKTGIDAFRDITWLDVGLEQRTRYEHRDDDIRRSNPLPNAGPAAKRAYAGGVDEPVLLKTRAYLGLKEILDPFRFAVEVQDSRRYNSRFAEDNRDVNEFEFIQAYGELFFKDALGKDDLGNNRPLSIKAGRLNFEFLDRRLIASNEWRNTTNTFQGFQVALGQDKNDWSLDGLALQPLDRLKYNTDKPIEQQWVYGAIGHWRKWSKWITLEPYYLGLRKSATQNPGDLDNRDIIAPALRAYGFIPGTGFNWDMDAMYQFGRSNDRNTGKALQQDAFGFTFEAGYTFDHPWKPRISAQYGYASGDKNPNDNKNNRFERFFGFARPWSADDYVVMENISAPKIRLEFQPRKNLSIDTGFGLYWLASDKDRFNNLFSVSDANDFNRDKTGQSGDYLGNSVDIRVRYQPFAHVATNIGYSHFTTGDFVRNRMVASNGNIPGMFEKDTDFFYVELTLNAFK
ncbi:MULTISPECIES: alginate export family protein [Methylomicrobium]|uniref:Alginate export domain-containing protein n=1 Tax=Methylomicrobium album BG8 TaxID=686340 RepID=H8GH25_METAL|nr:MULTISPECIES: alginate export family protein [Methylomicrobium]EIC31300.1 hypothetical protein Metal_3653 [Methylomicrobium album BG8]